MRRLEIGPHRQRIPGFETLDLLPGPLVDYEADCRRLPFPAGTFDLLYASHVIEHIPWYETDALLAEWVRVLAPGGALEIWTLNAYAIAKAMVQYEETGEWTGPRLGPGSWKHDWIQGDPLRWCSGRIFCYPKFGRGLADPQWHHALFTPTSLQQALKRAGLTDIRPMDRSEVRAYDHKWINMGARGVKPC